jgi:hypothetical protein
LQQNVFCNYGDYCYQKNPDHLEKFYHPKKVQLINTFIKVWYTMGEFQVNMRAVLAVIIWYWIYNYLYNWCLSSLMLWVPIPLSVRCTTLCDKVCQWLAAGRWFSPGTPVSSTNKTDGHDITEILLKVALKTITLTPIKVNMQGTSSFFILALDIDTVL